MIVTFGSINIDLLFDTATLPNPGETVHAHRLSMAPGGKGANQAVAAARDGASVYFAGACGSDIFAAPAMAGMIEAGIDVSRVRQLDMPTGCASVVTAAVRNQIVVSAGANAGARQSVIEDALLTPQTIVLTQMETDTSETEALILRAARRQARTIHNLAPASPISREALACLHLLVVNEHEADLLAGELGCAPSAAGLHAQLGVGVIRTLGEAGSEACTQGTLFRIDAVPVEAVDSTAAGDCFVGVLAAGLDRGMDLRDAMRRATAAAALCCTRNGSQGSLPDAREIDKAAVREGRSSFSEEKEAKRLSSFRLPRPRRL